MGRLRSEFLEARQLGLNFVSHHHHHRFQKDEG